MHGCRGADGSTEDAATMISTASRQLLGCRRAFVGVGSPSLAAMLACQAHAVTFGSVYESGLIDCKPRWLPYSVGDPHLVPTTTSIVNGLDVFSLILWRGDVDLGIIGTGQIDVAGNLNTTVIGEIIWSSWSLTPQIVWFERWTSSRRPLLHCVHRMHA